MFDDLSMSQLQELLGDPNLQEDLQTQLSLLQIAAPPIPAPAGTIAVADSMGIIHVTPGMMGTIAFPPPYPHVDMVVDGGEFTSFSSSNDAVVSNDRLNNYLESSSASAAILSQGQTTLTIGWTDDTGTPQTTSLIVVAS